MNSEEIGQPSLRERFSPEAFAAIRAHPRFEAAMRASNNNMLGMYESDPVSGGALRDIGRMLAAMLALHLHYTGGLTLARLRDLCEQLNITSRGRAFAILGLLRLVGYVRPAEGHGDGRVRAYEPTEALREIIRHRFLIEMDAAIMVGLEAGIEPIRSRFQEPEVFAAFMAMTADTLFSALQTSRAEKFDFDIFSHRTAGLVILGELLAGASADDSFPPKGKIRISLSALSRKFKVSRTHVMRLLRDAEAAQLIARGDNENEGYILPKLQWELQGYFAAGFLIIAACCRAASERLEAAPRGA